MCKECGHNNCGCNPCDPKTMKAMRVELDNMYQAVENISKATRFLTSGHPIIALEDAADIALFNTTTGKGSGIWTGWGICNGTTYPAGSGNITTPDLRDRFLVGSQGTYSVGSTGGSNTVALSVAEMPTHNHTLTDPGHTHVVNDTGHTHTASAANHSHSGTVDVAVTTSVNKAATPAVGGTAVVSVSSANTGISNNNANTGISIADNGSGDPHENRPPYSAVLFVKKIF